MKRTIILILIIALLGVGWFVGWHFVEHKVHDGMDKMRERLASRNQELNCADRQTGGFPFRITVSCESVSYRDRRTGLEVETGAIKSVAQAYQPNKVVLEFSEPGSLKAPDGTSYQASWAGMRGSVKAGLEGVERFSLVGRDLSITSGPLSATVAEVSGAQLHTQKHGTDDARIAVRASKVKSTVSGAPTFDGELAFTLENSFAELARQPDLLRLLISKGLSGTIDRFKYSPEESGSVTVEGPFKLTRQGVLSGKFQLTISEGQKLLAGMADTLPEYRKQLQQLSQAMSLLGKASGLGEIKLPISVREGNVSVGLIPIGKIKPFL